MNEELEWLWYEFGHYGNLEVSGQKNDVDFDLQVLHDIIVDGECFIRIIKDDYSEEYDHDWGLVKVMLENGA